MTIITIQTGNYPPHEAVLCEGCRTASPLETLVQPCQGCGQDTCPACGQSNQLCPDCHADLDANVRARQDELASHLWDLGLTMSKLTADLQTIMNRPTPESKLGGAK